MLRQVSSWIVLLSCLSALPAAAQDDADALISQAIEQRRAGEDAAALELLRRAHELSPSGRVLAQMGFAEQALGLWIATAEHLEAALTYEDEPWVVEHRDLIEESRTEALNRLGQVEIRGGVEGATVLVDGTERGRLPLEEPLLVDQESVELTVRADGYREFSRTITVIIGSLSRETVRLTPLPEPEPEPQPEPDPEPTPAATGIDETSQPEQSSPRDPTLAVLGWTAIGVGAAGLVVGVIGAGLWADNLATWNDDATCLVPGGPSRRDQCPGELEAIQTGEILTGVGFGVGGALAIAGAVLLAVDATEPDGWASACGPGPGLFGLACGASF